MAAARRYDWPDRRLAPRLLASVAAGGPPGRSSGSALRLLVWVAHWLSVLQAQTVDAGDSRMYGIMF